MISVIIVAHGKMAEGLLSTAKMVLGPQKRMRAFSVSSSSNTDKLIDKLGSLIDELDEGQGVLIMTDLFGGTPANISLSFLGQKKVEVITGVNLPMIIKTANLSESDDLEYVRDQVVAYGKENILNANRILDNA
ncbi:MAG: PTS sugar transporter subunit IIA [bacterium]